MLPNLKIPGGRWHLAEICDQSFVPSILQNALQETLTSQWTTRLPFIQKQSPAVLASTLVAEVLDSVQGDNWKVIDFCSGAGGPIPFIETTLNRQRQLEGRKPIPFLLSDLYPNLDAWVTHSSHSAHLTFIPQPVDAANPPFAAISATTPGDKIAAKNAGYVHDGTKVLRLFCLAFHHFDNVVAKQVVKSTMETSDAFMILELQDRSLWSLGLMGLEFWLVLLVTVFWYPRHWLRMIGTYFVPVLPVVHAFDGMVSCLRTRTFEEFIDIVDQVKGRRHDVEVRGIGITVRRGDWVFTNYRILHTWPIGYMGVIVGRKIGTAVATD